jgi:hypothetical protein
MFHVDITFDFLTELAEYDRISGDQAFLAQHWPATLKAYQYCLSTLDKSDGLPRVPERVRERKCVGLQYGSSGRDDVARASARRC